VQTEFEINHAISYAQYVASLPLSSGYLAQALPRLKSLLSGLLAQGNIADATRSSPSSSSGATVDGVAGTVPHAQLFEALLKAVLWVGWAREELRAEVGELLGHLLDQVEGLMKSSADMGESYRSCLLSDLYSSNDACSVPSGAPLVHPRHLVPMSSASPSL
jgi:phosphatidylinositol 4-kinase